MKILVAEIKGDRPEFITQGIADAMRFGAPESVVKNLRIEYLNELIYQEEKTPDPNKKLKPKCLNLK